MTAIDLTGKTGVVFGVANQRSIAWAIASALADAGADLVFTYLNERLRGPVEKTVSGLADPLLVECDATSDEQVERVYDAVAERHGRVDIVVHSIAFADRKDLGGDFSASDLQGFRTALEVSAYTLIPIVSRAVPHMGEEGGSVVALTFDAANRVYPGYNIMGTAKAALEKRGPATGQRIRPPKRTGERRIRPGRCRRSPPAPYPASTPCAAPTPTGRP